MYDYYASAEEEWRDKDAEIKILNDRFNKRIWTTSNGTTINVSDMSNKHINNCIDMLKGKGLASKWIVIFEDELKRR